jgi:hypothetical protein
MKLTVEELKKLAATAAEYTMAPEFAAAARIGNIVPEDAEDVYVNVDVQNRTCAFHTKQGWCYITFIPYTGYTIICAKIGVKQDACLVNLSLEGAYEKICEFADNTK